MKRWLRLLLTLSILASGLYAAARLDDWLGSGFRDWQQGRSAPSEIDAAGRSVVGYQGQEAVFLDPQQLAVVVSFS